MSRSEHHPGTVSERVVTLVGWEPPGMMRARMRLAQSLLCVCFVAESTVALTRPAGSSPGLLIELAVAVVLLVGSSIRRTGHLAAFALPAFILIRIVAAFPKAPNHWYVGLVFALLLAYVAAFECRGRLVGFCLLRWLFICVTVGAGVQKLIHGQYFHAEYFNFLAMRDEHFHAVLGLLGGAPDVEGLQAAVSGGNEISFGSESPLVVVLSNAALWLEIALPLGVLAARWRGFFVVALIPFFIGVEAVTFEYGFVGTMLSLLLLFVPTRYLKAHTTVTVVAIVFGAVGYAMLR